MCREPSRLPAGPAQAQGNPCLVIKITQLWPDFFFHILVPSLISSGTLIQVLTIYTPYLIHLENWYSKKYSYLWDFLVSPNEWIHEKSLTQCLACSNASRNIKCWVSFPLPFLLIEFFLVAPPSCVCPESHPSLFRQACYAAGTCLLPPAWPVPRTCSLCSPSLPISTNQQSCVSTPSPAETYLNSFIYSSFILSI